MCVGVNKVLKGVCLGGYNVDGWVWDGSEWMLKGTRWLSGCGREQGG